MTLHWKHMDRDARIAAVIRLRDLGHSRSAIAAELHVTVGSLHGFVFRQQIEGIQGEKPRTGGWYDLNTPTKVGRIEALRDQGRSAGEIADEIGITRSALYRFCHHHRVAVSNRVASLAPPVGPPMRQDTRPIRDDAWTVLPTHAPRVMTTTLVENDGGCCWPVDDGSGSFKQCGHARHKKSYCLSHYRIAYPSSAKPFDEVSVNWLAGEDARAANRRQRVSAAVDRPTKREAVRYDDE